MRDRESSQYMTGIKKHLKDLYRTDPDEKSRKGFLCLDMNEGVPGLPEDFVRDILSGIGSDFLSTYPEYKVLREKIALNNGLKIENITLSNGSNGAIKHIFDAYISPGDKVLIAEPTFAMYRVYCDMFNANVVSLSYNPDLSFPLDGFLGKLSTDVKLAVVVNPNNPTGSALDRKSLLAIIRKAHDTKTLIIVDEAYFYFYPESIINEINSFDNLIILRTFSKLCGMAAARLGYAASCPGIAEDLKKVKSTYDVNALAVFFAERLLEKPEIIKRLAQTQEEGKKYLISKLLESKIEHKAGSANFILIKCEGRVKKIQNELAERGILVAAGFKQPFLKDYIRVTTGDRTIMKKFWKAYTDIKAHSNV